MQEGVYLQKKEMKIFKPGTLSPFFRLSNSIILQINKIFNYNNSLKKDIDLIIGNQSIEDWISSGKKFPAPAAYKLLIFKGFIEKYKCEIFIETGTFIGNTIDMLKNEFQELHTIELDYKLYKSAVKRFSKFPHIHLHQGDSKDVIPQILKTKTKPALYWLDGHYSGGVTAKGESDTPILQELKEILSKYNDDIILIDDARLFVGQNGYPAYHSLEKYVQSFNLGLQIENHDDIIRIFK